MALTATATSQTRQKVCKSLCMEGCFVFSKLPNENNIDSVVKGPKMKQQVLKPMIDNIHRFGSGADRCIVFVHTYEQCEELFFYAAQQLGARNALYVPSSDKKMPKSLCRTCDMFTACTASSVKKNIVQSFTDPSGNLRLLIATTAFGMGIESMHLIFVM